MPLLQCVLRQSSAYTGERGGCREFRRSGRSADIKMLSSRGYAWDDSVFLCVFLYSVGDMPV